MNRSIKFRAWDKEQKLMFWNVQDAYDTLANHHPPSMEEPSDDNSYKYVIYDACFGSVLKNEDLVVMQFTGLKDKNGCEIYEGDIVLHTFYSGIQEVGRIVWNSGAARFVWYAKDGCDGYGMQARDYGDREVIGNIYETPEIIK